MTRTLAIFLFVFVMLYSFKSMVEAAPILDQENVTGSPQALFGGGSVEEGAQSFTVGLTGMLTSVEVKIQSPSVPFDVTLGIYETFGVTPIETVIAEVTIKNISSLPSTAQWLLFDLSSFDISVTTGETYAIGLGSQTDGMFWLGSYGNHYAGGFSWLRVTDGS